ncbi:MAG: hypothetical protein DSY43_05550 [Gammaproteobacteria bacterium]|nr:MAG: hypothetical protein DSY43_05550 [Gammaproteobacteria bacterium]
MTANIDNQERLLPTALAKLHANGKEIVIRVLVDCGSDHSYIRKEVAEALNLISNGPPKTMTIFMHGGQSRTTKVKNVNFQVSDIFNNSKKRINLSAWSVRAVCAPLEPIQVDITRYKHLKGLNLADQFPRREASTIDVLIGADQWSQVMLNGMRKGPLSTPFAMNSIFGWLLSGCAGGISSNDPPHHKSITNYAVVRLEDDVNKDTTFSLKKFWELESIGISDEQQKKEMSGEEDYALQQFHSTISFDGERYEVGLPWKRNHPELASNYPQALRRMFKVERALHEDERKEKMYKEAMQQYFKDGNRGR